MMNKDFLSDLNPEQYQAATTLEGPLLCIAGAGTGKTKTLISRVANLLCNGVAPDRILLLTFTKKAANEMKDRILAFDAIKEVSGADEILATTFHSFCNLVLIQYGHLLGYKDNFKVLDENDSMDVLTIYYRQEREKFPDDTPLDDFPTRKELLEAYSYSVSEMVSYAEAYDHLKLCPQYKSVAETIIGEYEKFKKEHNMIDFEGLLHNTYLLLSGFENVRSKLDERYEYIMCDEYQDTNVIQDRLLDLLSKDHNNLCVVGDDNQCWAPECRVLLENGEYRRVDELKTGDMVESFRNGKFVFAPITNIVKIPNSAIIRFLTENGKTIRVSANHKMFIWPRHELFQEKKIVLMSDEDRYMIQSPDAAPEYFDNYRQARLRADELSEKLGLKLNEKISYDPQREQLETLEAIDLYMGEMIPVKNKDHIELEQIRILAPDGFGPTYSIEIADTGCMVANGILSHNSIYRFRCARIENILTFQKRHNNCPQITLSRNYRSTQEILDFANAMMSHAKEGISKQLVGFTNGRRVAFDVFPEERLQAMTIVDMIEERIAAGVDPKELCVMGRIGRSTYMVEAELRKRKIPFVKYGGPGLFDKAIIRNVLFFLRACDSIDDEIAWINMLTLLPGVGPKKAKEMYEEAKVCGLEVLDSVRYANDKCGEKLSYIVKMFKTMREDSPKVQLDLVISFYTKLEEEKIKASKCEPDTIKEKLEKFHGDLPDLETLKELSVSYPSVRVMLTDFALNLPDKEDGSAKVNVTTVHSAKGLEYETVFLINPVQGIFPKSRDDTDETREDLRCMYVAVTRPKKELFISLCKSLLIFGKVVEGEPSKFFAYDDVLFNAEHPVMFKYLFSEFGED